MDQDLSVEITALEHVFGPFEQDVDVLAASRQLSLTLIPYTGDDDTVFVECTVHFCLGLRYPDQPPEVNITHCKGLSDQRIGVILDAMHQEAQQLAGEHMLMSMCMVAKETLSQQNHPEGVCPFCLEPMEDSTQCIRGSCFHGYHKSCFRRWWQWRVLQEELEKQKREENRRTIGLGMASKQAKDMRAPLCPICSSHIPQAQLDSVLLPSEAQQGYPEPATTNEDEARHSCLLDASLIAFIESVSSQHRQIAAAQKAS